MLEAISVGEEAHVVRGNKIWFPAGPPRRELPLPSNLSITRKGRVVGGFLLWVLGGCGVFGFLLDLLLSF